MGFSSLRLSTSLLMCCLEWLCDQAQCSPSELGTCMYEALRQLDTNPNARISMSQGMVLPVQPTAGAHLYPAICT